VTHAQSFIDVASRRLRAGSMESIEDTMDEEASVQLSKRAIGAIDNA
jgi:hypothetical protein